MFLGIADAETSVSLTDHIQIINNEPKRREQNKHCITNQNH